MTPTEQAASVLADVPRHADSQGYEPEYILETDALAAIARHLAPGDDAVLIDALLNEPGFDKDWREAAAARISALTATVGEAREQRSDAEARMETAESEVAALRDRLAAMEGALRQINVGDGWAARIARAALTDGGKHE